MIHLPRSEYLRRRQQVISQMEAGGLAIIPAAPELIRNRDAEFPYRQDSDFYYLTGFNEPEALLVLMPGRVEGEHILLCRERNPEMETWTGRRAGQEGAVADYGMDEAFPIDNADQLLPELMADRHVVYSTFEGKAEFDQQLQGWMSTVRSRQRKGVQAPGKRMALDCILHAMRLIKSEAEIDIMRQAAAVSCRAHMRAMMVCKEGLYEHNLEAEILHECGMRGVRYQAYNPIVGSGENGCILHYNENNALLKDGDLVLIDAGCEVDNYASDITRTFPVSGKFTSEQKAIYEIVLDAQQKAIASVKPGNTWNQPHDVTVQVITEGLANLGLLKGDVEQLIEDEAYKPFYMHRAGHWIGMDVHDVGDYKVDGEWRPLKPGMVMTVEPGIYIAPDNEDVDTRWRGIGIRIEDDIVVTAIGHENLTEFVPKTVEEIESLMAS